MLYLKTAFSENINPSFSSGVKSKSDVTVVNGSLTRTFKDQKYFFIPFYVPPSHNLIERGKIFSTVVQTQIAII